MSYKQTGPSQENTQKNTHIQIPKPTVKLKQQALVHM